MHLQMQAHFVGIVGIRLMGHTTTTQSATAFHPVCACEQASTTYVQQGLCCAHGTGGVVAGHVGGGCNGVRLITGGGPQEGGDGLGGRGLLCQGSQLFAAQQVLEMALAAGSCIGTMWGGGWKVDGYGYGGGGGFRFASRLTKVAARTRPPPTSTPAALRPVSP